MRASSIVAIAACAALTCGIASPLRAQSAAISGLTGTSEVSSRWTWGWEFTVGSYDIQVTHLGTWDNAGNGLRVDHYMGIWLPGASPTLLVSTVIPSGTAATLENGFRWVQLATPIVLSANITYRIGDEPAGSGTEDYEQMLNIPASNLTMHPAITYGGRVTNQADEFSYPSILVADLARIGPNFKFQPANVIPEPSLIQLPLLLGFGGGALWWRRRRG